MNLDKTKKQRRQDALKTLHAFAHDLKQLLDKYPHVFLRGAIDQCATAEYEGDGIWEFIYLNER